MSVLLRLTLLLLFVTSCSIAIGQCKVNAGNAVSMCLNDSRAITAVPSGGTVVSYSWNSIPAGNPETGNPFTVPTSATGTFVYEVTATFAGCIAKDTVTVTVNPLPVANFTFPATATCSGAAIVFTSSVSGGTAPYTYAWDFGDGQTSAAANPSHAFTSLGCATAPFNVTLTITDSKGCSGTAVTKAITILQAPDVQVKDQNIFTPFSNCTNAPTPANPNYTLTIDNSSPSASCITSYDVDWGDGVIQNGATFPITHTYTKLDAFNLKVTAVGANGCKSSKTYVVANQTNPAGSLGTLGSTTNLCAPAVVPFTIGNWQINSPGTIYMLDFGDGNTITLNHPLNTTMADEVINHTYTTSSCPIVSFTATLRVVNGCDNTPYTAGNIQIRVKPTASFTANPDPGCVGKSVCFVSTGLPGYYGNNCSAISNDTWDFGDGSPVYTGANPCHIYTAPGTYTVKSTSANPCGSSSFSLPVCIAPVPIPAFTLNTPGGCAPLAVTATNTTNTLNACEAATYLWSVSYTADFCGSAPSWNFTNGSTDTSANPSFSFINPGIYTITLSVKSACGSYTIDKTVVVQKKPQVTIGPVSSVCANGSITPTAVVAGCSSTMPLQYNWTFPNGSPATSSSLVPGSIAYPSLGTHAIQLSVTNECGVTTDNSSVNVIAPPAANAGPDKDFCSRSGSAIGATGVAGVVYSWSPATGLSDPNSANPYLNLTYSGNNADTVFSYAVTASAGANCSSTDTVSVRVKRRPVVVLNPLNKHVCAGDVAQLTAAGATSYNWSPSASLDNNNTDTVIAGPTVTTGYQVVGTGTNGCADTASVTVTVQPYPPVNAGNDSIVCNNTNAARFEGTPAGGSWSGTNITSAGVFNPQLSGNGSYVLKYTAGLNQCTISDSLLVTVIDPPKANAGSDTTVCQFNNTIRFVGSPAGGNWSGAAFVNPAGDFTPATVGAYTLIYTFGAGSCIAKDSVVVNVIGNITNNVITGDQDVCNNTQPALLTGQAATGGNGAPTYQWQSSTDNISWTNITGETGLNYSPPVLTQTSFYRRIAATVLCNGTQANTSAPVKVTWHPDAKALFTAGSASGCSPFDLGKTIRVSAFNDRNGLYEWYADNSLIASNGTGAFPGYTMQNASDTVTIKLRTSSQYGCKPDSIEQQFITAITAQAMFNKDTSSGCGPLPVRFTNSSSRLNDIQFLWDFGNGSTSNLAQPGLIIFNSSAFFSDTTYQVSLRAYNGCDSTIWRDSVKVRAGPKARFGVDTTFGCSPFTIEINNTSPGIANTFYWDFGDGGTDTTFVNGILNHTYHVGNAVDTFTVRMVAENQCRRDTQTLNVRVAPNPIRPLINVSSSELFGCSPHIVSFNNNTSGATGYTWDFGDNTSPVITNNNQSRVVHQFDSAGLFNVSVMITNGCSDTTVFRQVNVYPKPLAAFTTNDSIFCAGDAVRVINNSQNATNYTWFWGDGTNSTTSEPVHVFAISGNYNIVLRAERTNNSGLVCIDTFVRPVTVLSKPVVTIQSNISAINCAPFILHVLAPGIANENVSWYFYDSTVTPSVITSQNISAQYAFNKPGSFYVKLVAKNARGCADSSIIRFTVSGKAAASFSPSDIAVCTRDTTVNYINGSTYDGTDPVSYSWLVDKVPISGDVSFMHRFNVLPAAVLPRTFNIALVVSNTVGCSDTANATLTMNPVARAQFSIANPGDCVPFKPVLVDGSTYTTSYQWLLNGTVVSNDSNPGIVITEGSKPYTIQLVADNSYGCKPDTFKLGFTSRARPAASFRLSDTLGCTGVLNIGTTNLTTGAGTYLWNFGDGTPNSTFHDPTHLYTAQGQYLVTLVASDGVCTDTTEQLVKVSIKPVADFSENQTITCDTARVQFINLSTNGSGYTWSFGDGTFTNVTNPSKLFTPNPIPYTVKLVAFSTFGCRDSIVKPNLVFARVPPASDFVISPSPVITVPNYTFNFNNLTLNSTNYRYLWSLGDGSFATTRDVTHKYIDTGNYAIRLIVLDTASNCTDTTTKIARVDGFPGYLYVPNAICPNCIQSDLREFLPKGMGLKEYRLQIYTTWNELIFETRVLDNKGAPTQAWDGRFKGAIVQQDVYVWRIDAKFLNGSEWTGMTYPGEGKYKKAGTITVIK